MTNTIDFYFDFISPYSYLAHQKLIHINKENKIKINYRPVLLGGLHKLGEITAPAFNERKMKNMRDDCELVAKKNNIKFKWNSNFPVNSLHLMRGFLVIDDKIKNEYIDVCFKAYWKDDINISEEDKINEILKNCKIENLKFLKDIQNPKIKDELKQLTKMAFDKNVFGAPTFVVNNKLFWGQDRLEYAVEEYYS
tara:strand:+ start:485 stop:1069 length:585 start_codon:yes stop_codon:yes gene_type:complete